MQAIFILDLLKPSLDVFDKEKIMIWVCLIRINFFLLHAPKVNYGASPQSVWYFFAFEGNTFEQ